MRKYTEQEIKQRYDELLDHLNQVADCERHKADFNAAVNKEIRYHAGIIDVLRQELNAGGEETSKQAELPIK